MAREMAPAAEHTDLPLRHRRQLPERKLCCWKPRGGNLLQQQLGTNKTLKGDFHYKPLALTSSW